MNQNIYFPDETHLSDKKHFLKIATFKQILNMLLMKY